MILAVLVLNILLLLIAIAVLVMAIVLVVQLGRSRRQLVEGGDSLRRIVETNQGALTTALRAILTVQTANNRFLAGHGLPPDPTVLERRKEYEDEVVAAGREAGIPVQDIMRLMRDGETDDYAPRL